MPTRIQDIEQRLWQAADELRANSKLSSQEYSVPVLGLIFLRYADYRFQKAKEALEAERAQGSSRRRRGISDADYQARGVMVVPEEARYGSLLALPEAANIGQAVADAMRAIEARNPDLKGVLPKTYNRLSNDVLVVLLKNFNSVPMDIEGDAFGRIYEYFLSQFAMGEGRRGGEFFTPLPSYASSWRSWNRTTGASWTRPAAPGACSCRARASWKNTATATTGRRP